VGEYTRGVVAMANSGADTNGSQFFICVADLSTLPKSYTIFGTVTSGMDVVDQIVNAPAGPGDLPNDPVAMSTITVSNP
jgi:peptidyl-prolyl cis-trans isomerase B (cyclophilin B)